MSEPRPIDHSASSGSESFSTGRTVIVLAEVEGELNTQTVSDRPEGADTGE